MAGSAVITAAACAAPMTGWGKRPEGFSVKGGWAAPLVRGGVLAAGVRGRGSVRGGGDARPAGQCVGGSPVGLRSTAGARAAAMIRGAAAQSAPTVKARAK